MPTHILMPALSPTMEEGKLAKWLVKEGSKVKPGDVIAEIETDKATMEVETVDEGTIARLLVPAGTDKVKVNTPIATLIGDGETAAPTPAAQPRLAPQPTPPVAPAVRAAPSPPQAAPRGANHTSDRRAASPLARRIARERGINLGAVEGSGPHGRVIKRDLEQMPEDRAPRPQASPPGGAAARQLGEAAAPMLATPAPLATQLAVQAMPDKQILALYEQGAYEVVPHDGMRRVIAQRLTQSKQTIPHFYLSMDCRLDNLLAARERLNARAPKDGRGAYKLSVNDFVIKALALALQQVPAANATWTEQGMLRHKRSDVGVAVAVDGGLFTPVIRHADLKTLSEISNEMKDMAKRARNKRLAPHEYQGGTTSISNLGMYGVKSFDAVINPPHATILAVGAAEKMPVVAADRVEIATVMSTTLSCDHRVVDGAIGADLLAAFKSYIEDPVRMLV